MANGNIIYDKEGLESIGQEYTTLATQLRTSINEFGTLIDTLTQSGVKGAEAPTQLLSLWNGGGENGGVRDAMLSYASKLDEAAANLHTMAVNTTTVDTSAGETATNIVKVMQ